MTLKNFRGFKELKISDLARVNLITGKNNTGKTAFLEAIFLCCGFLDSESKVHQMFRSAAQQGGENDFQAWLLHRSEDLATGADLSVDISGGQQRSVYLRNGLQPRRRFDVATAQFGEIRLFETDRRNPDVDVPAFLVHSFSTYPSQPTSDAIEFTYAAKKSGGEEKIESLLREVEPRLRKVRAFQIAGSANSLVYADIGLNDLIPVTQLGQGFNRLLKIYSAMLADESQICLIDELENGLHHSVLREVWKGLAALARQENVQIFATTHSWECVVAAHEVFRESDPYDFALHRLERINGEIQAVTYDRETLDAVEQLEMEVR